MKRKMKWMLSLIMVVILAAASVTGCGNNQAGGTGTEADKNSETITDTIAESSSELMDSENADTSEGESTDASTGGKVLVVYYSATGSTKAVAEKIATLTGGDLFELKPAEEYTSADLDYNNSSSRVCREHDNADLRDVALVSDTVDNFDAYSEVLIGYPIWWGIAAWPVNQFVENNDFTGQNVIPFCTSASSGLGDSGNLLEEMAGTGNWQEGKRFSSNASEKEVQDWVESLNLK